MLDFAAGNTKKGDEAALIHLPSNHRNVGFLKISVNIYLYSTSDKDDGNERGRKSPKNQIIGIDPVS